MNYDYRIIVKNACNVEIYNEVIEKCIDENQAFEIFIDNNIITSGDTITIEEVRSYED